VFPSRRRGRGGGGSVGRGGGWCGMARKGYLEGARRHEGTHGVLRQGGTALLVGTNDRLEGLRQDGAHVDEGIGDWKADTGKWEGGAGGVRGEGGRRGIEAISILLARLATRGFPCVPKQDVIMAITSAWHLLASRCCASSEASGERERVGCPLHGLSDPNLTTTLHSILAEDFLPYLSEITVVLEGLWLGSHDGDPKDMSLLVQSQLASVGVPRAGQSPSSPDPNDFARASRSQRPSATGQPCG